MSERKTEEFEDDRKKWKIYFDLEPPNHPMGRGDSNVIVSFISNKSQPLSESDIKKLKEDLKDIGKLRIIKQGKKFLDDR